MTHDATTLAASHSPVSHGLRAVLAVVAGDEPSVRTLAPGGALTLGRSSSCDWSFTDTQASRVQAIVRFDDEAGLSIEDPGSRNGTFLDDERVHTPQPWLPGQVVRFGAVRLVATITGARADEEDAADDTEDDGVVVSSPQMVETFGLADRAARSEATVLVLGETGTGKEVLADRIHRKSKRRRGPFVTLNCGSLVETLAESTLFGHERGAFTGAAQRHAGVFEQAHEGTLFLDEVGELSANLQTRLLRVLEDGRVTRVGGSTQTEVNVRVVAATHRDLPEMVRAGEFREDLLYRLDVVRIRVPPLRERTEDVEPLALHFLDQFAGGRPLRLSAGARRALLAHPFPGNVRELRNCMERAVALAADVVIHEGDLNLSSRTSAERGGLLRAQVGDEEKRAVLEALEACEGNQTRAAKRLGIARRTLINKMEKYGLHGKGK
ncbi:MAG: sigma 54-interacting transcriptional regulator [Sandaracinaceae bacterium]|nr:sigma 54-interacting transcriptional regulator [Myxococcales bacterium]MCB9660748.1 sigma 54-interacting transcriptional regulator [Sandaracinaceae bacterium]